MGKPEVDEARPSHLHRGDVRRGFGGERPGEGGGQFPGVAPRCFGGD